MKTIVAVLLSLLFAPLFPALAQEANLGGAEVTIPYAELKSLLDAAHRSEAEKPEPEPPVASMLISARYDLDFSEANPTLTAKFEARGFADAWHAVPLFGGDPRLASSEPNPPGESVSVIWKDNVYTLLARGAGDFSAHLTLTAPPFAEWKRGEPFALCPAPAAFNELRVTGLPDGLQLRIDGLTPTLDSDGAAVFHLPGDGGELSLVLGEKPKSAKEMPVVESAWTLQSQILARYEDGRLHHSARIQAQADSGSGLSMALALPPSVSRVTVEGDDLKDWKLLPRSEENREIRISWETRDVLDRTLLVSWEIPQSPLADTWLLSPPHALIPEGIEKEAGDESRSLIALMPVDGLELTHPSLRNLVESQRLPAWLREQLGAADCLTAEITGDAPLDLAASWLPRMETAQATISLAAFDTRLVADGSMLVTADYTVNHNAPLNWKLTLPSADQILQCEVNRQAAKPIRRADNEIEFRLPTPVSLTDPDGKETGTGTTVHLCYALKSDPLDPVSGRVALELPQTELFIHRLDWALSIPDRYEPTAIEGNVQLSTIPSKSKGGSNSNQIHLEKELCRGERPAVEIYYQRKDLSTQS